MDEDTKYLGKDNNGGERFEIKYGPIGEKTIVITHSISDLLQPIEVLKK